MSTSPTLLRARTLFVFDLKRLSDDSSASSCQIIILVDNSRTIEMKLYNLIEENYPYQYMRPIGAGKKQ